MWRSEGACDGAELGHLTGLLQKLQPSVDLVRGGGNLPGDEFVQEVASKNVEHVVRQIREKSQVIEGVIAVGDVGIVGAMYSVQSGDVEFHDLCCRKTE